MDNSSKFALMAFTVLGLSGCGILGKGEAKYPTGMDRTMAGDANIYDKPQGVFGKDGLLGGSRGRDNSRGDNGIDVNSYLWRASLDTISFMPLASADPFGGTIITDWYTDPSSPSERTKLNVFILGRELKADGVKVKAFRQVKRSGGWVDAPVAADTSRKLEDAILTRARQMRVAKEEGGLF
ncbi:MAG: DUF3576 domain-containing protein [Micavibrio aeruginosavorus]|uniref:DUF3576 domain-containing protein n=1 Tax=Micavibrio aeruginosavorus TaxID=349221 RepID=A0A2W5HH38_9BACT|nr:MAG: DUF3576 domain-containing protein [Micavibrio aeruginosavorus]